MDKEDTTHPVSNDQIEDNTSDLSESDAEGDAVDEGEESESDESGSDISEHEPDGMSAISSDESDGGSDKCAICLQKFMGQEIGLPETCEHYFCLKCLTQWSKKVATCPVDRKIFPSILVKDNINGPVLRIVDVEIPEVDNSVLLDEYNTDPTYCEICGHCDREDRLLLCDGCDLGYHLECLEPPLEYVPIEDWYCSTCEAQSLPTSSSAATSRPSRRQLRLPRTGQSRRILESIRQSVRETAPTSCSANATAAPAARRSTKRKVTRKARKTSRRKTTRNTRGRKTKRKTKKGRKRTRVALERRPTTAKGRLAVHLGIVPPRPGQVYVGLPSCRASSSTGGHSSNSSVLRNLRCQAGITPLRMFSTSEDLADFVETMSDDDEVPSGSAISRLNLPTKSGISSASRFDCQPQTSPDVLGPILNNQIIMLTDKNIQIKRDGTLVPSIGEDLKKTAPNTSPSSALGSSSFSRGNSSTSVVNSLAKSTTGVSSSPKSNDSGSVDSCSYSTKSYTEKRGSESLTEGTSHSRKSADGSSWNPSSHGSLSGSKSDPNGTKAYEHFLHTSDRKSPSKSDTEQSDSCGDSESKINDDDEDYNIYSDIEEDAVSQDPDLKPVETESIAVKEREDEECSDSELIIDEDRRVSSATVSERRSPPHAAEESNRSLKKNKPPSKSEFAIQSPDNDNFSSMPSPDSIPLPDSTPPPMDINDEDRLSSDNVSEHGGVEERDTAKIIYNNRASLGSGAQSSASGSKTEYDPSQPLTSSDEEEHSTNLTHPPRLPVRSARSRVPLNRPLNAHRDGEIDISSIPMPSDDYRRPTIQFSIPTRHKLLSISSLIKRQRGVAKKENENVLNFASEVSKAFGKDKNDESGEDELETSEGGARVSVVAEIFGSDDDEGKFDKNDEENELNNTAGNSESTPVLTSVPTLVVPFEYPEHQDSGPHLSLRTDMPRWKTIPIDQSQPESLPLNQIASDFDAQSKDDSDDSIAVLETIQPNKLDADDDIQVLSISKATIRNTLDIASVKRNQMETEKSPLSSDYSKFEPCSTRTDINSDSRHKIRKDREKKAEKEQLKQKRSHTPNREEGEIVDSPEKQRKSKGKKLKKSKESKSRTEFAHMETIETNIAAQNSSEEENKSDRTVWRKSSNSTKERNYRDRKPKREEKHVKTSDKKNENTTREHSEQLTKGNADKAGKLCTDKHDSRRSRRRLALSRSRSRSLSTPRTISRRFNSRSRRSTSYNRSFLSRSRSRSPRRYRNRRRSSISPRGARSGSGSRESHRVVVRSRSPLESRKNRRRSSSLNHAQQSMGRKRLGSSSSSSLSSKREWKSSRDEITERRKSSKPKEKHRSKEKVQELKDHDKDPDKKKRRKRREKSMSPAKEIFASGDNIVVSLNFQKNNSTPDGHPRKSEGEKKKVRNRIRHGRPSDSGRGANPRVLKKTLLIDLESSPMQEQNIGVSPTLIVLSDDENGDQLPKKNSDITESRQDPNVVTTAIGPKRHNTLPSRPENSSNSTQHHHSITPGAKTGNSNSSPSRGDSLVTSTRNSENGMHHDDESQSPPRSPSGMGGHAKINYLNSPPRSLPQISSGTPSSLYGSGNVNEYANGSSSGGSHPSGQSSLSVGKPLIGNLLGLFPAPGVSTMNPGNLRVPLPIATPVPPAPAQQSSMNQNLFTTNVLASMASALYAPILAARQQQQTIGTAKYPSEMNSTNSSTTKNLNSSFTVLLPKTQIASGKRSKSQTIGEGGSPFSPNSSDGDDLFEPPLDHRQNNSATPTKAEKVNGSQTSNPTTASTFNSSGNTGKPREKRALFDSLFGPTPKKTSHEKGHSKSSKGKGSSGHSKAKPKKTKKEIVKLTEGELRLTEDVPNSAVELEVKEKFLMKLNHQDRVVDEVKLSLKPHYSKKHVTKEEYKEILRRAVPKICHNKSGEINPLKIKELVEAYVKKFRHARKKV